MPTKTHQDGDITVTESWWGVWNVALWGNAMRDSRGMPVNWVTQILGVAEDWVSSWAPVFAHAVRKFFDTLERLAKGTGFWNKLLWHAGAVVFPVMAAVALPILYVSGRGRTIKRKYAIP